MNALDADRQFFSALAGLIGDTPFAASSRYTHVFVDQQGEWRLATAQGTQILQTQPVGRRSGRPTSTKV